jgi:hypothetical protein
MTNVAWLLRAVGVEPLVIGAVHSIASQSAGARAHTRPPPTCGHPHAPPVRLGERRLRRHACTRAPRHRAPRGCTGHAPSKHRSFSPRLPFHPPNTYRCVPIKLHECAARGPGSASSLPVVAGVAHSTATPFGSRVSDAVPPASAMRRPTGRGGTPRGRTGRGVGSRARWTHTRSARESAGQRPGARALTSGTGTAYPPQ